MQHLQCLNGFTLPFERCMSFQQPMIEHNEFLLKVGEY